jgi:hypothetical protein
MVMENSLVQKVVYEFENKFIDLKKMKLKKIMDKKITI